MNYIIYLKKKNDNAANLNFKINEILRKKYENIILTFKNIFNNEYF